MNKFQIVIGGSGDIGIAIVSKILATGKNVIYTYNKNMSSVQTLKEIACKMMYKGQIIPLKLDVTSDDDISNLNNIIEEYEIAIESVTYNVGITEDNLFYNLTETSFNKVMDYNLNGCIRICKTLIDNIAINRGSIVLISSISGMTGRIGQVSYSCSKAGLIALGRNLANEYAKFGVRVNSISPGYIKSQMLNSLPESKLDEILRSIPLKRLGNPSDVANMALFLINEECQYITGQTIVIDGGLLNR